MTDLCWSWTCSPACSSAWRSLWHSAGWSASTPRLITQVIYVFSCHFVVFCLKTDLCWRCIWSPAHLTQPGSLSLAGSFSWMIKCLVYSQIFFFSLDNQLLLPRVWPVRGLQQSVTLPEYLEIPQRVILHSVTIHVELESSRGVWSDNLKRVETRNSRQILL